MRKPFATMISRLCARQLPLWLLIAMLMLVPSIVYAQAGTGIIRVAATGSDVSGCGSAASPCRTVQYAADEVIDGDEILIATGVYTDTGVVGSLASINKELTLAGGYTTTNWTAPDPEANPTVLDGEGLGRVLYIEGSGITVTLSGLTLQRGSVQGVYVRDARLLMMDCAVISSTSGNAIYLYKSDGSQVHGSRVANNIGTGVCVYYSDNVTLSDNTISDNSGYGVCLHDYNNHATLSNNIIASNNSYGVYIFRNNDYATLSNNTISSNGSRGVNVGSYNNDYLTLVGNTIADNSNDGVYFRGSDYQLDNNIIARNGGDGVEWRSGSGVLRYNTLSDNSGDAGLRVGSASLVLTNTIIAGHTYGIRTTSTSANVQADHTLWYSNTTDTDNSGGGTISTTHDLYGDPLFAGGVDPFVAYHLGAGSAAIDTGIAAGLLVDIDGESRPYDAGYGVGADEYPGVATPPTEITISGPITGVVQVGYTFTATVSPITATPPIHYVW